MPEIAVREAFETFGTMRSDICFHKGLFKDTVPNWKKTDPIAALRIDGNYHDSYQDALCCMHESVPVGGIVIFDDVMSHPPVMRCWTDFKREQNLTENLQQIDKHSAWFCKERVVKIDMTHFRAPQDANI